METKKYALMDVDFGHRLSFLAANEEKANEILFNWVCYHSLSHRDFWVEETTKYSATDLSTFAN